MSAKKILVACAIVLVGLIYYYLYHDSFSKRNIPIQVMFRPRIDPRMRRMAAPATGPEDDNIVFGLSRDFKLTSVEVVSLDDLRTNKYAHAVWHLVSDSNSVPTTTFAYGGKIRGMHPEVKGLAADPLLPNASYRITIKAGAEKGEHDFKTPPELTAGQ